MTENSKKEIEESIESVSDEEKDEFIEEIRKIINSAPDLFEALRLDSWEKMEENKKLNEQT